MRSLGLLGAVYRTAPSALGSEVSMGFAPPRPETTEELRGRVVVITGAGGIGSETARAFAREGCRVAVCDVLEGRLERAPDRGVRGRCGRAMGPDRRARQQRCLWAAPAVPQDERGGYTGPATNELHGRRLRDQGRDGVYGTGEERPHHQHRLRGRQAPDAKLRQLRCDQGGSRLALPDAPGRAL